MKKKAIMIILATGLLLGLNIGSAHSAPKIPAASFPTVETKVIKSVSMREGHIRFFMINDNGVKLKVKIHFRYVNNYNGAIYFTCKTIDGEDIISGEFRINSEPERIGTLRLNFVGETTPNGEYVRQTSRIIVEILEEVDATIK